MASFFVLTIFVSSYLLFLVQPMLAKMLLPHVGGAASVWIVSMLFFQLLLLAGYAYAAISSRLTSPLVQSIVQFLLYGAVLLIYVPLTPTMLPSTVAADMPERWVFYTLFFTVGMPYFLLTANSSILQRWYYAVFEKEPYHLFSASNAGSFLGLFSYPFLWEWLYGLDMQLLYWGAGFALIALLFSFFPLLFHRLQQGKPEVALHRQEIGSLPLGHVLRIILLGFIPSSLFLSVTLYVTTDVASLPMLWIIPLALYLLSFVIVFAPWGERWISIAQKIHPLFLLFFLISFAFHHTITGLLIHFALFFGVAISVHGQLARIRPAPENLTIYFFWMSVGGVLGGLFNVLAPYLFDDVYEYILVMLLSLFALPSRYAAKDILRSLRREWKKALAVVIGVSVTIPMIWLMPGEDVASEYPGGNEILHQERNFFGVSRVISANDHMRFRHGTTLHGIQAKDEDRRLKPLSYYVPVDAMLQQVPDSFYAHPFGVLGLGAGTLACYGRSGQEVDFFEIDRAVVRIAENADYFSYLRDCPPEVNNYVGDGRIRLQEKPDHRYNLLVLDAFSSDSVPMHLLTHEAVVLYKKKIRQPEGILAFNVSNRYLRLQPFLTKIAESLGMEAWYQEFVNDASIEESLIADSQWLLMVSPDSGWQPMLAAQGFKRQQPQAQTPLWTDNYSNILPAFKWR